MLRGMYRRIFLGGVGWSLVFVFRRAHFTFDKTNAE